ncbi:hypothetical protein DVH05_005548 [Phytophthora capsici]|nr:hypothetical protein DVH05_005548 [Phytophthora capsici]
MRSHAIAREEFMLGFGHGSRVTSPLPNFTAAWQSFTASPPVGPADVRSALTRFFPAPGATGGVLVDIGGRAISYVTPRGAKTSAIPAAFAWRCVATTPYDDTDPVDLDRLHESSDDIGLPLLTLEDTISTPCDLVSTIRAAGLPPAPAASAAPRAPQRDIDQSAAHTFLQRLLQEQRDANASFRSQMETMSATLAALQQRVTQPSPLPLPQERAGHTTATGPSRPRSSRCRRAANGQARMAASRRRRATAFAGRLPKCTWAGGAGPA